MMGNLDVFDGFQLESQNLTLKFLNVLQNLEVHGESQ